MADPCDCRVWVIGGQPTHLNKMGTTPGAGNEMGFPFIVDAAQLSPSGPTHSFPQLLGNSAAHILLCESPLAKGPPSRHGC